MHPIMIFFAVLDGVIFLSFIVWLVNELRFFFSFTLPMRRGVRISGKLRVRREFR